MVTETLTVGEKQVNQGDNHSNRDAGGIWTERLVSILVAHPEVTYQEMGQLIGLSKQRVCQIARQAGITRREKPRRYRDDITVKQVLELYRRNMLVKDIAQALGCSHVTVRSRLREAGVGKRECYSRSMKLAWRGKRGA